MKFVEINQTLASMAFSNTNIVKVGIAVKDDLKDLKKLFFFKLKMLLDLNILASNLGFESIVQKNCLH